MGEDQPEGSENHPSVQWARRSADVHAGLANERLQDLVERLRRLSSALSVRGDDLTAGALDDECDRLRRLKGLLDDLESANHHDRRSERPRLDGPIRPRLATLMHPGPEPDDDQE